MGSHHNYDFDRYFQALVNARKAFTNALDMVTDGPLLPDDKRRVTTELKHLRRDTKIILRANHFTL